MMSSVIAAFFHCVSGKNNSLHGQCPEGSESWCRYQRAKAAGSPLKEIEQGLPNKIINQIKPTYLKLCNETLLKKCLHGHATKHRTYTTIPDNTDYMLLRFVFILVLHCLGQLRCLISLSQRTHSGPMGMRFQPYRNFEEKTRLLESFWHEIQMYTIRELYITPGDSLHSG
ncbi:uncharacterized protein LOC101238613 [Trichonephila clavipes]|nr:uncharacterized protein LOC101238613 [Trichonephila clavipes]